MGTESEGVVIWKAAGLEYPLEFLLYHQLGHKIYNLLSNGFCHQKNVIKVQYKSSHCPTVGANGNWRTSFQCCHVANGDGLFPRDSAKPHHRHSDLPLQVPLSLQREAG